jgi:hypothetical protein
MRWLLLLLLFCCGCGTKLQPGENYSRAEAQEGLKHGQPVVQAIFRFEADHGLWPDTLQDLVPNYLTAEEARLWRYHTF